MVIDDLYMAILGRLLGPTPDPPTGIATVDWNNGQFEDMQNGVNKTALRLPAALVRYEAQQWHALGKNCTHTDAVIYIDIGQSIVGERLASDLDAQRTVNARTQFELELRCQKRLHKLTGAGWGPFKFVMMEQDHAFDNLRVTTIAFKSRLFIDMTLVPPTIHGMPTPVITYNLTQQGGDFNRDFGADFHNRTAVQ